MTEQFLLYLIWSILLFIFGISGLYFIGIKVLTYNLHKQSQKLQARMNYLQGSLSHYSENPQEMLREALSGGDLSGLLRSVGIDPSIVENPLVKGLISKYAPKIIEQLSKTNKTQQQPPAYGMGDSL